MLSRPSEARTSQLLLECVSVQLLAVLDCGDAQGIRTTSLRSTCWQDALDVIVVRKLANVVVVDGNVRVGYEQR